MTSLSNENVDIWETVAFSPRPAGQSSNSDGVAEFWYAPILQRTPISGGWLYRGARHANGLGNEWTGLVFVPEAK